MFIACMGIKLAKNGGGVGVVAGEFAFEFFRLKYLPSLHLLQKPRQSLHQRFVSDLAVYSVCVQTGFEDADSTCCDLLYCVQGIFCGGEDYFCTQDSDYCSGACASSACE